MIIWICKKCKNKNSSVMCGCAFCGHTRSIKRFTDEENHRHITDKEIINLKGGDNNE